MALIGYIKNSERKSGGIRMIGLVEKSAITEVTLDSGKTGYTAITISGSSKFAKYEFREDEAEFKETVSIQNGSTVVTHELKFMLERMCEDTTWAVNEIVKASHGGLIALIVTANNDVFVAGYSIEFEKERPLKLTSATGTTGKQLKDSTYEIITLYNEDVAKARPFLGNLQTLF